MGFKSFQVSGFSPQVSLIAALDSGRALASQLSPSFLLTMGQQLNKHIKKKRRVAYHKRRNARIKAAISKAKK